METPVGDSPLAQRVRDEGASLFQGFSFECPSLLHRRRSRPHSEPVEDCFFDFRISDAQSSAADGVAGDGARVSVENTDDEVAAFVSTHPACESVDKQWFDVPPPAVVDEQREAVGDEQREASPTNFFDIEEGLLSGTVGRLKQGSSSSGSGAKASRPKVVSHSQI